MKRIEHKLIKVLPIVQLVMTLVWLCLLASTDAYFSVYVVIAFLSFYLQIKHFYRSSFNVERSGFVSVLLSLVLSLLVLSANYPIFTTLGDPEVIGRSTSIVVNLINAFLCFFGGIAVFCPIVYGFFSCLPLCGKQVADKCSHKFFVFFAFVCINLIHLFLVEYPGNLTEDSFTQISEIVSGSYSNFNTFWHTMLLRTVLVFGYTVFSDINAAIALFNVFQILILAAAFTYSLMTMRSLQVPHSFLVAAFFIYGFLPYNIALSVTIWKDVLFAAGCLIMLSAWIRIVILSEHRGFWDYIIFAAGSLLFIISRTNGWIIYLLTFLVAAFSFRKHKAFLSLMGGLAFAGWFLLNPALSLLNVPNGDMVESLSIPIQQVSRVICENCPLTEEESQMLSRVLDFEDVQQNYTSWLSDPMKEEIRTKDLAYFEAHLNEYGKLWVRLGLRYPVQYWKAWVDQTKGYWNAGYDYFLYAETITENPYGVEKLVSGNPIASLFRLYFGLSRHLIFFEPLHSIGLYVWIFFLCFAFNLVKRRRVAVICIPLVILILGLCLGTPVYCSFRYVYPLFVSFPLLVSATLYTADP